MKSSKTTHKPKRSAATVVPAAPAEPGPSLALCTRLLHRVLRALSGVFAGALNGPFLLDDSYLPYMLPNFYVLPIGDWIRGLRPLLMFSFWLNFKESGNQVTFGYHLVNVALHFLNGVLIYFAIRKVLSWINVERSRQEILAAFAAGLFLFHPIQTESVSYVASRSETLSLVFILAAYVVFLYRKSASRRGWNRHRDPDSLRRGASEQGTQRGASGALVADRLLLESRIHIRGHPAQLEAICSYRDWRSASASCSCSGS